MHQEQVDIPARIAELAQQEPYEQALLTIRGYARGLLDTGYPRDTLTTDFERARTILQSRDVPEEGEEAEEAVLDVMDFLSGFSSPHMKL